MIQYPNKDEQNAALEETILKPLQNPENPTESWLAFYAPTPDTIEKLKLKRKLEELGRDVPEEVIILFIDLFFFRNMTTNS